MPAITIVLNRFRILAVLLGWGSVGGDSPQRGGLPCVLAESGFFFQQCASSLTHADRVVISFGML
jgi:hypothetical protein